MKDRTFRGSDVADALRLAEQALGVPASRFRYVVLNPGSPPALGLQGSPAEIAVLGEQPEPPPAEEPAAEELAAGEPENPRDLVLRMIRALAQAADLEVGVGIDEEGETLKVVLTGPDEAFFLANDAEVLEELEYLLRRMLPPRPRLTLECEGRKAEREEGLRRTARELAALVLKDGATRSTPPLNSYERRIIHMTVAETPGLRTRSVGEGADRRVTISPVFPEDAE